MKILFFTTVFDTHALELLRELRRAKHYLAIFSIPGNVENRSLFDEVVSEPDSCLDFDLMYFLFNPDIPLKKLCSLVLQKIDIPLIVDVSRGSYWPNFFSDFKDLKLSFDCADVLVVREDDQLASFPNYSGKKILVLEDYLRFSFLPRTVIADILWQMQALCKADLQEEPPSSFLDLLLSAPVGSNEASAMAASILEYYPHFYPALLRLALLSKEVVSKEITQKLIHEANNDPLYFMHDLSLIKHFSVTDPFYSRLINLKEMVYPHLVEKRKKIRILLIVIYKQRDLFKDLLQSYFLQQMGYEVIMRPLTGKVKEHVVELVPDVIIWGAKTTPYQCMLARFVKDRGILSIVCREEGAIYLPNWIRTTQQGKSFTLSEDNYAPYVDLEIGCNSQFRRIISTEGRMPDNRCHCVGGLAFDIYCCEQMAEIFPDKNSFCSRVGLDPDKKNLVIATSWPYADRDPETAIAEAGCSDKGAFEESLRAVRVCRRGRAAYLDLLKRFCEDYSDTWNVIVKVHPGEKKTQYEKFILENDLPAVTLISDYMAEVLIHTDLLIHAGSTTALEAHILHKPSYIYWRDEEKDYPMYSLSEYGRTYDEFKAFFINKFKPREQTIAAEKVRYVEKTMYGTIDGHSSLRAAIVIDQFIKGQNFMPFRYPSDVIPEPYSDHENDSYGTLVTIEELDYFSEGVAKALKGGGQEKKAKQYLQTL